MALDVDGIIGIKQVQIQLRRVGRTVVQRVKQHGWHFGLEEAMLALSLALSCQALLLAIIAF